MRGGAGRGAAHRLGRPAAPTSASILDDFWERADVEVDGDPELQQAVRFGLFHVLQAGARAERRAIPAKGLTGPGYDGHAFWDTETFVLPVLTYTCARRRGATRCAGGTRRSTSARERAAAARPARARRSRGARSRGRECSGYWPAGTAAFHINADIAEAVAALRATPPATTDVRARRRPAAARRDRAAVALARPPRHARRASGSTGVTGPDEYSALADDNVYTNLMARAEPAAAAADVAERHPDAARGAGGRRRRGRGLAPTRPTRCACPTTAILDVHPQAEGFTDHARWDFEATPPDHYPLLLHYPYFDLYRKQVVKQADLVLALYLLRRPLHRRARRRATSPTTRR